MIRLTDTSFISALLFFIAALGLIMYLRRRTKMLEDTGALSLVTAFILAAVRLFLPIYLPFSQIISIPALWPEVSLYFREHPYIWLFFLVPWLIVVVSIVIYDVSCICYTHLYYSSCVPVPCPRADEAAKQLGITCPVVASFQVDGACVVGLFRHTIYLPVADTFDERHLQMVLEHEFRHVRSFHNEIKAFYGLVSALLWPSLIPLYFRKDLDYLLELRCDEKVIGPLDTLERYEYAQALVESGRIMVGAKSYAMSGDRSSFKKAPDPVEQRYGLLLFRMDKPVPKITAKTACLMALVFVLSYSVIFEPRVYPVPEDFEVDSGISYYSGYSDRYNSHRGEDGTFIYKRADGRYELCINYQFEKYLSPDEVNSEQYKDIPIYKEETDP